MGFRENNRKKDGNKASENKMSLKWLVYVFLIIVELLIYTGTRLEHVNTEFRIADAKSRQEHLKSEKSQLLLEKDRLSAPERISEIARTRLDLIVPDHNQIVYLDNRDHL
ncbi:MAG: cell division protein FtsL [Thermodesulfobacteriota bacterium]|nr:cell division protein FtsL [Thermodesulfobacteriota bacterium]